MLPAKLNQQTRTKIGNYSSYLGLISTVVVVASFFGYLDSVNFRYVFTLTPLPMLNLILCVLNPDALFNVNRIFYVCAILANVCLFWEFLKNLPILCVSNSIAILITFVFFLIEGEIIRLLSE